MLYTDCTDRELLPLIKAGDAAAFEVLYKRHWQSLFDAARNVLRSTEMAKDIVQEVFASLWQRRAELDIAFPRAYLHQAVRFQVLTAIRAHRADAGFYARLAEVSRDMVLEDTLVFKELQHILKELISILPPDCREAFLLSREEDLTYREIADQMNISVKTVEKKMTRSLRILRSRWNKTGMTILLLLSGLIK